MRKKFDDAVIISLYTQEHLTLRQIARVAEMSQTAIWKRLKKAGIKAEDGERVNTSCGYCGLKINRTRAKFKNNNKLFCNMDCYAAYLENPNYRPVSHGSRLARAVVGQYFHLDPENIVHHEDGDQRNNDRKNLRVFFNDSDHIKYHRAETKPKPIWDGSLL